jgi:hypothetical protein
MPFKSCSTNQCVIHGPDEVVLCQCKPAHPRVVNALQCINASKLCTRSSSDVLPIERVICVSLRVAAVKGAAVICIELQALRQPLREVRVRDEPATEDDQVCIARLELGHSVVTVEATGSDKLDATFL